MDHTPEVGPTVPRSELPSKQCPVCGRTFSWRRRWARCWEEVVYCSERCRRSRPRRAMADA
ncbi:MAG: DUF2256 domain-containing protein [Chromatiales bacterium]